MYDQAVLNQLKQDGSLLTQVVGRHVSLVDGGGGELKGCCPFHSERTPSFYVVPDKGFCHCFGCGWGGDIFDFVQQLSGLDFPAAIEEVADEAGIPVVVGAPQVRTRHVLRSGLLEVCSAAHVYYRQHVNKAQDYLRQRGLDASVELWELGYAPDEWDGLCRFLTSRRVELKAAHEAGVLGRSERTGRYYDFFRGRLVFPIRDDRGRVVGFAGRSTSPEVKPKYLNTPETPLYQKSKLLYGLSEALRSIRKTKRIILVEGYTDVMAMHAAGHGETVAACGTALTDEHIARISRLTNVVYEAKDPDKAGRLSMEKDLPRFLKAGVQVYRVPLDSLDPDELVLKHGAASLSEKVSQAEPLLPEVIGWVSRRYPFTPQGRHAAAEAVLPFLRPLRGVGRSEGLQRAARTLSVDARVLARMCGGRELAPARERIRTLDPLCQSVIWGLAHHKQRVDRVVREQLRPEWLEPEERTIVMSMMQEAPCYGLFSSLPPWAARSLRALMAERSRHGAGEIRDIVREYCTRLELRYIEGSLGSQVNGVRFTMQQRRLELLDSLAATP